MIAEFTAECPEELFIDDEMKFKTGNPRLERTGTLFIITGRTEKDIDKARRSIQNIEILYKKVQTIK